MMKLLVRGMGAALVAAVVLVPKVTIADEVSDSERMGEYDEDGGQRFGAIAVTGDLVATANSPSGWALVRTYENKTDEPAHTQVEERITSTLTIWGARVSPAPQVVLTRTQTFDLKPHEKKTIGVYIADELGKQITEGRKTQASIQANMGAMGNLDREYHTFAVEYLRPLAKGETAEKPFDNGILHPARMPDPPPPPMPPQVAQGAKPSAPETVF